MLACRAIDPGTIFSFFLRSLKNAFTSPFEAALHRGMLICTPNGGEDERPTSSSNCLPFSSKSNSLRVSSVVI